MRVYSESNSRLELHQIATRSKIIFEPENQSWGSIYRDGASVWIPTYALGCKHTGMESKQSHQWKIFSGQLLGWHWSKTFPVLTSKAAPHPPHCARGQRCRISRCSFSALQDSSVPGMSCGCVNNLPKTQHCFLQTRRVLQTKQILSSAAVTKTQVKGVQGEAARPNYIPGSQALPSGNVQREEGQLKCPMGWGRRKKHPVTWAGGGALQLPSWCRVEKQHKHLPLSKHGLLTSPAHKCFAL